MTTISLSRANKNIDRNIIQINNYIHQDGINKGTETQTETETEPVILPKPLFVRKIHKKNPIELTDSPFGIFHKNS